MNPEHVIDCCLDNIQKNQKIIDSWDDYVKEETEKFSKTIWHRWFNCKYEENIYDMGWWMKFGSTRKITEYKKIIDRAQYYYDKSALMPEILDAEYDYVNFNTIFYRFCKEKGLTL